MKANQKLLNVLLAQRQSAKVSFSNFRQNKYKLDIKDSLHLNFDYKFLENLICMHNGQFEEGKTSIQRTLYQTAINLTNTYQPDELQLQQIRNQWDKFNIESRQATFFSTTGQIANAGIFQNRVSKRQFAKKRGKEPEQEQVPIEIDLNPFEQSMDESVNILKDKLSQITAGRLDPKFFDSVWIADLGSNLKEHAQIIPRSHTEIIIKPFDLQQIDHISQALHLTSQPIQIRKEAQTALIVSLSKQGKEKKDVDIRTAKQLLEDAKQAIRRHRQSAIQLIKKGNLSKDDTKKLQDEVQDITDKHTKSAEKLYEQKEREILS